MKLQEHERQRRHATIRRESKRARQALRELDAAALDRLRALYERARDRVQGDIIELADGSGTLRVQVLQELRRRIEARIADLADQRGQLLDESLDRAAALGAGVFAEQVDPAVISRVSDEAVRFVRTFVAEDGLQLSDRIWRVDQAAREDLTRAVESAVVRGESASRAAREFLTRGDEVPGDVADKVSDANAATVARRAGRDLLRQPDARSAHENARRVFRTEINRAHGEAYQRVAFEQPDVIGTRFLLSPRHPRRDICDMHATVNRYGLGPGVYPQGRNPWPAHPNTLSFVEVVFRDEVTDDDRAGRQDRIAWLRDQRPGVQEAVLNSRRKRLALERGWLRENQIATPWKDLKERLRRQGRDVDSLEPEAA